MVMGFTGRKTLNNDLSRLGMANGFSAEDLGRNHSGSRSPAGVAAHAAPARPGETGLRPHAPMACRVTKLRRLDNIGSPFPAHPLEADALAADAQNRDNALK